MLDYRKDIDGLRGISIILVLLYHFNFNGFRGGYIGVDIFFVISGYLITSIILKKKTYEKFYLIEFYTGRIKRIFPALFLVCVLTTIIGLQFLNVDEMENVALSSLYSLIFLSNLKYINDQSGYFYTTEEPLLHTWSLSVEGQFYILFPLLFVLFKDRKFIFFLILIALLTSFALAQLGGNLKFSYPFIEKKLSFFSAPSFSFFLTYTRIWEILFGSLIAINYKKLNRYFTHSFFSYTGLVLIFISLLIFNDPTVFHPGFNTLLPIIGATFIILNQNKKNYVYYILNCKFLIFIGLISYSLYLIHYPILEFAKIYNIFPLLITEKILLIFLSIFLSIISWKFVEIPIRKNKKFSKQLTITLPAFLLIISIISYIFLKNQTFVKNKLIISNELYKFAKIIDKKMDKCWNEPNQFRSKIKFNVEDSCIRGNEDSLPNLALLGDSHAASLAESLEKNFQSKNKSFVQLTYNGCLPVQNILIWGNYRYDCEMYYKEVIKYLNKNKNIKQIIFTARWPFYFEGKDYYLDSVKEKKLNSLNYFENNSIRILELEKQITQFFEKLKSMDLDIIVINSVPEPGLNVPKTIARTKKFEKDSNIYIYSNFDKFKIRNKKTDKFMNNLKKALDLKIINAEDFLCDSIQNRCILTNNKNPIYFDEQHLNLNGANIVINQIKNLLIF